MNIRIFTTFLSIGMVMFSITSHAQVEEMNISSLSRTKATHFLDGIWMRDPYVVIGPDNYYYLTYTSGKTDLPVWKSPDLIGWERLETGYCLEKLTYFQESIEDEAELLQTRGEPKVWAPELYYVDGRWIVVHTTNFKQSSISSSATPDFMVFDECMGRAIGKKHDPSLFVDDDGTKWLVCRCAELWELMPDFSGFTGKHISIKPSDRKMGHEGCQIIKYKDKYIWFGTGWSSDEMRKGTYNLYYATADNIEGPYSERRLAGKYLGHGTVFQDKEGQWWCTAFRNGVYVTPEEAANGIDNTKAITINPLGATLVPISIDITNGDAVIKVLDPNYQ